MNEKLLRTCLLIGALMTPSACSIVRATGDTVEATAEGTGEVVHGIGHGTGEVIHETGRGVSHAVTGTGRALRDAAHDASE